METIQFSPKFSIGQKVYRSKEFGSCNYLERYDAQEIIIKNIRMEFDLAKNSIRYVYDFEGKNYSIYEDGIYETPEELFAIYLTEIKKMMPESMQNYIRENI